MKARLIILFAALSLAIGPAQAGAAAVKHIDPVEAARLSKAVEKDIAAHGARLALVFRSGRPRKSLPEGLSYTHGAFWVYQPARTADGRMIDGYAVYNLYQGDGKALPVDRAHLVQDFPFDFTAAAAEDDLAVIIPTPDMQRRILKVMASPTYERMFNPAYSTIANPFRATYQNCNGFLLNVIGAALWNIDDPAAVRTKLATEFKPSVVNVTGLKRMLAPLASPAVKTDDQGPVIQTAAYESIAAFMMQNHLAEATYVIKGGS